MATATPLFTDAEPPTARRSGFERRRRTDGRSVNVTSLELSWDEHDALRDVAARRHTTKSAELRRGLAIVRAIDDNADALAVAAARLGLTEDEAVAAAVRQYLAAQEAPTS